MKPKAEFKIKYYFILSPECIDLIKDVNCLLESSPKATCFERPVADLLSFLVAHTECKIRTLIRVLNLGPGITAVRWTILTGLDVTGIN